MFDRQVRLLNMLGVHARNRDGHICQAGEVALVCDGERRVLAAGDCVTFDADLPHHFENPGTEPAALLAVVSAGLRRS